MTTEEALAEAQTNDTGAGEVIVIDNDLRTIIIPASITLLGVVSDENVQTLHFQMPKTYKGLDLSEFAIRINYMNANNVGDTYAVDDSEISGENIVFTWTVGRVACMYKGNTKFIVCLKKKDVSGNVLKEFNTSLASLPVLEGLETTEAVVAENPDIIEQILTKLDNVTEIPQEKVSSAVEEYMAKNPINIPKKLPNPHKLTFAGAVTAEYDGSGAVTVTIPEVSVKKIPRITDGGKEEVAAAVSFIDDDCRSAAYDTLFPLIKELDIPYTLACPPGKIGADLYMTQEQLLEMYNYGVTISCHTWAETNMDTLSKDQLEENLKKCVEKYREWGITDVNSYAYTQGKYSVDNMSVVKKYFNMGFLVNKGINIIPYETYYMRRVGLFPTDNSFSLSDAKAYVDKLLTSGGWLIFMTHCWTSTFNVTELKELVSYIKGKSVQIIDVNEMIEKTGNVVDIGYYKKDDLNTGKHYFVVDFTGKIWTDQFSSDTGEKIETVELTIKTSYSIGKETSSAYKGKLLALTSTNTKFKVCEPVDVTDCSKVLITGWSYSGYGIYSFLDESGECASAKWATKTASEGGNSVVEERVKVPAGAKTLIIAGHSDYVLPALSKVRQ